MEIWFKENVTDAEWEAHAEECRAASKKHGADLHKSYEDDQWNFYSGSISNNYYYESCLALKKGIDWHYRLVDFDGNIADAKKVDGKYGKVWLVKKSDGSIEWVSVSLAQDPKREQAHYAKKGYRIAQVYYRSYFRYGKSHAIPNTEPVEIFYIGQEEEANV